MNPRTFYNFIALTGVLILHSLTFADNGHLVVTSKTDKFNVALFAEPWPARVGEFQLQFMITDSQGNLIKNNSVLTLNTPTSITLENTGVFTVQYALQGIEQPPIEIEVLQQESLLKSYWQIWLFLVFGLIFIILREKLAKNHARRYPSI